jgi:hypothetical protein
VHENADEIVVVGAFGNAEEVAGNGVEEETAVDEADEVEVGGEVDCEVGDGIGHQEHGKYQQSDDEVVHEVSKTAGDLGREVERIASVLDGLVDIGLVFFLHLQGVIEIEN